MSDESGKVSFTLDTTLAFEKQKQAAVFAWCLFDEKFCDACSKVVQGDWFTSPYVRLLYNGLMELYSELGRIPNRMELLDHRDFARKEEADRQALKETLVDAMRQCDTYKLDLLRKEMTKWMHAVIFFQAMQAAARLYNARKVDDAWLVVDDAALLKATATFEEKATAAFKAASERIMGERAERERQAPLILPYGVSFLQDSLGGIIPNDLIVVGAKTGHGKTQLVTSIAKAVAAKGYPVHYFALEAEEDEIERRIKYGIISAAYYAVGKNRPPISYTDWRMQKLDHILGQYEKDLEPEFLKATANLNTLYNVDGRFDGKQLEKHILKIVGKTRLIVIDHLHYIETEGQDENRDYKRIIKLCRSLVLKHGIPIIVVAHLRKDMKTKGGPGLISVIEDFHGTSDVPKVSTTCVMLAPAFDRAAPEDHPHWWPTYMGVVKSRLEGGRTRYTGMTYFDPHTTGYADTYRIGKMEAGNHEWRELFGQDIPYWAVEAIEADKDHKL